MSIKSLIRPLTYVSLFRIPNNVRKLEQRVTIGGNDNPKFQNALKVSLAIHHMFSKAVGEDTIQAWHLTMLSGQTCLTFGCRVLSHESQGNSVPLHPDINPSCLRNPMLIHTANNVVDYYKRVPSERPGSKYVNFLPFEFYG